MKDKKIYIVEDDKYIRQLLMKIFTLEGAKVTVFEDGKDFLKVFRKNLPDIVLLDIMLPKSNGYSICKEILNVSKIPVVMITAKFHIDDKIKGLELGADDYITKPFHIREVVLRVSKLLQRYEYSSNKNERSNVFNITPRILIFVDEYRVLVDGEEIKLNPKEFELLKYLVKNKGLIVSRDKILDSVWGIDFYGDIRTVDINIQRIRKKLNLKKDKNVIETVFGIGYRLNVIDEVVNEDVQI